MIGGEPGVGKTRLAEELMAEARQRNMTALIGRCYEMEGAPPYIPFVEMLEAAARTATPEGFRAALGDSAGEVARIMPELRRLFPDIPPPLELPPEQERHYLFNSVREFLERTGRAQPLILILDDLHWADDATLFLLEHVAQRLSTMPVLVVATYRDVELDVGRPLARAFEELLRQRLAHGMTLKQLPEAQVSAMLAALAGREPTAVLVDAVYRETEGNPFFVEEVFKHLSEEGKLFDANSRWRSDLSIGELDVPRGVRLVIQRRLRRVGEECRRLLTAAAVIGRPFSFQLLEAMDELDPEALLDAVDEAERACLITSTTDGPVEQFTFVHELIRQTLVSEIVGPRRQRLHLRIVEAMVRVCGRALEEHAADLFHHLDRAGVAAAPAQIGHYLSLAGQQAARAAAIKDDVGLYDKALSVQPADLHYRADLLYYRGEAQRRMGHWKNALADWEEALATFEELGDTKAVARVAVAIADHLAYGEDRWQEAALFARRGRTALGRRGKAGRLRRLAQATATILKRPLRFLTR